MRLITCIFIVKYSCHCENYCSYLDSTPPILTTQPYAPMKKVSLLLSLLFCFHLHTRAQTPLRGPALSLSLDGYVGSAGPYQGVGGSAYFRYEFKMQPVGTNMVIFPSAGLGVFGITYGGGIIAPLELNLGYNLKKVGLFTSFGVIANSEWGLLHPAVLPTLHGTTRLKSKKRFFFDFEYRIIKHYIYSGVYTHYNPPFTNRGWGTAVGVGFGLGWYLEKKVKKEHPE